MSKPIRAGIVGATGYTAVELIYILLRHPLVKITQVTSRSDDEATIDAVHPSLRKRLDLGVTRFDPEIFVKQVDIAFCCLPHAASSAIVGDLANRGIRVIDFSADYRLDSLEDFQRIYQAEHADPGRLGSTPYGLPELFCDQIRKAQIVANPGCFPTSAILPLAPLIREGVISMEDIIIDSKTGISGGGRTPRPAFHFPECNESMTAYSVGVHRHGPEIEQVIGRWTGERIRSVFVPHLAPMTRGILSTIYVRPVKSRTATDVLVVLDAFYRDSRFVRISRDLPGTKDVSGTNYCDVTTRDAGDRIVIVSAIDNLVKGASGAAVQNMNVMFGFDESTAL